MISFISPPNQALHHPTQLALNYSQLNHELEIIYPLKLFTLNLNHSAIPPAGFMIPDS